MKTTRLSTIHGLINDILTEFAGKDQILISRERLEEMEKLANLSKEEMEEEAETIIKDAGYIGIGFMWHTDDVRTIAENNHEDIPLTEEDIKAIQESVEKSASFDATVGLTHEGIESAIEVWIEKHKIKKSA